MKPNRPRNSLPSQHPSAIDSTSKRLRRLRQFTQLLDNAIVIPGTRYRIGLDPLIGLIPGGGDTAGLVLSSYIVLEAARLGASKSVLSQMVFNILLETIAGTVPVVGDVFDAAWKSNARNMALLDDHLQVSIGDRPQNRWFALLLIGGLVIAFIGCVALSVWIIRWLVQQFQ